MGYVKSNELNHYIISHYRQWKQLRQNKPPANFVNKNVLFGFHIYIYI